MYIFQTVLKTFLKVLTRRICLTIKSFFSWWSFPLFLWPLDVWFRDDIVTKHLNASHSLVLKGYNGQNKMCLSKNWERRKKKKVFWEMHRKKIVNMFFDFHFSISIYLMYPLFFSSIYFENSTVYRCKQLLKKVNVVYTPETC